MQQTVTSYGRVRDSQRQRVYNWERKAFQPAHVNIGPAGLKDQPSTALIAINDAILVVAEVCNRFNVPMAKVVRMSAKIKRWSAVYYHLDRSIHLPPTCAIGTVLHEIAHHVCEVYFGELGRYHGPYFVGCYIAIMESCGYKRVPVAMKKRLRTITDRDLRRFIETRQEATRSEAAKVAMAMGARMMS